MPAALGGEDLFTLDGNLLVVKAAVVGRASRRLYLCGFDERYGAATKLGLLVRCEPFQKAIVGSHEPALFFDGQRQVQTVVSGVIHLDRYSRCSLA